MKESKGKERRVCMNLPDYTKKKVISLKDTNKIIGAKITRVRKFPKGTKGWFDESRENGMRYAIMLLQLVIFTMIFLPHWMNLMRVLRHHVTHLRFWKMEMMKVRMKRRIAIIVVISSIGHSLPYPCIPSLSLHHSSCSSIFPFSPSVCQTHPLSLSYSGNVVSYDRFHRRNDHPPLNRLSIVP